MPFTISHILQRKTSSRITRRFISQRTHTATDLPELSNISLINTKDAKIPRNSQKWKTHYDHRTAAERVFKRQKLDSKLNQFKTRSKARHLFYALLTAMAVHVETWFQLDQQNT